MIYSMTGYAREEIKAEWGSAVWELRSVNQRYLETYFRLPEQFRALEIPLRERLRKQLQRGKVECSLRLVVGSEQATVLHVNEAFATEVIQCAQWLQAQGATAAIDPLEVLRWPGVLSTEEADSDQMQAQLLAGFELALTSFLAHRAAEGANMQQLIEERLTTISQQANQVRERMPEIIQWQRERLSSRFEEARIELDSERLEQEMVLLAQKVDVAEELDRLDSHIKETRNTLKKGGACGRRLDFMMQEFNREANTLGSKSIHADITASAVEIKVLIEQMREQIQNIE